MTPDQQLVQIQTEAGASRHLVAPAVELVRTSPEFRRMLILACTPKRTQCPMCLLPIGHPDCDGHPFPPRT